ncbi:MAG: circadian clock KaiB family protein [Alphaproteobacteria bacterium]
MQARSTATRLSLYGAEGSHSSWRAWTNVTQVLEALGMDTAALEFVNVLRHPARTFDDGVLVTPTLIVLNGGKRYVIVGTVDDPGILEEILAERTMEQ